MPIFQAELEDGRKIQFEAERQPTEQELNDVLASQAQPSPAGGTAPQKTSAAGTFARSAATSVLPTAAFGTAFGEVAPIATIAAAETGPFAPLIGGGAGLVAGTLAALGVGKAQQKIIEKVSPETAATIAQGQQEHPIAAIGGELAGGLPTFKLATKPAEWTAKKLAERAAIGAGLGAITPPILEQRAPTLEDVGAGAAFTALYSGQRFKTSLLPRARAALGRTTERTVPNASEVSKAAAVYGDVRSQPAEGQREVSTQEGGAGVQSQAPALGQERTLSLEAKIFRTTDGKWEVVQQHPSGETKIVVDTLEDAKIQADLMERTAFGVERESKEPAIDVEEVKAQESAEREAITAAEALGLKAEVSDKPPDENVPWARDWGNAVAYHAGGGKVYINRKNLHEWLSRNPENRQRMIESLVGEEHIHSKVSDADAESYWNNLTAAEKRLIESSYLDSGETQASAGLSDTQMGHEGIRRTLQYLARLPMMEVEERASAIGRFSQKTIAFLEQLIRRIRTTLGTKASKVQTEILDRVQSNLDAGTAVEGEGAAARMRGIGTSDAFEEWRDQYERVSKEANALSLALKNHPDLRAVQGPRLPAQVVAELPDDLQKLYRLRQFQHELASMPYWDAYNKALPFGVEKMEGFPRIGPGTGPQARFRRGRETSEQGMMFLPPTAERLERPGAEELGGKQGLPVTPAAIQAEVSAHLTEPFVPLELRTPTKSRIVKGKPESASARAQREASRLQEVKKPSFEKFVEQVQSKFGDVQKEQLWDTWKDVTTKRLMEAKGEELRNLWRRLGLTLGRAGERTMEPPKIADPPAQKMLEVNIPSEGPQLAKRLVQGAETFTGEQRARLRAISRIQSELFKRGPEPKSLTQKTLAPEDVAHWQDSTEPAWNPIGAHYSQGELARVLTADARKSGQVVSATKRVTAIQDKKTGKVYLAGTFLDPRRGAVIVDPQSPGRTTAQLDSILKRYRPIVSVLNAHPVKGFIQAFDSLADFEARYGTKARGLVAEAESRAQRYDPATFAQTYEPRSGETIPGIYQQGAGVLEQAARDKLTDSEAGALLDHLNDEVGGKVESPEDVWLAIEGLKDQKRWDVISAYQKIFSALQRKNPDMANVDIMGKMADQIYEIQKEGFREDFIQRAQAAYNRPDVEPLSAATPPVARQAPTGARELTMRERIPPTITRGEVLPKGAPEARLPEPVPPELMSAEQSEYAAREAAIRQAAREVERYPFLKSEAEAADALLKSQVAKAEDLSQKLNKEPTAARFRGARDAAEDAYVSLSGKIRGTLARAAVKSDISGERDGAETIARTMGRNAYRAITIESFSKAFKNGNPEVLAAARAVNAAYVYDQATRKFVPDPNRYADFLRDIATGEAEARNLLASHDRRERYAGRRWLKAAQDLKAEVLYAQAHHGDPELMKTAQALRSELFRVLRAEQHAGFSVKEKSNYLPGLYEGELFNDDSVTFGPAEFLGKRYAKPSVFANYYEAIANGPFVPVSNNVADLVGHRVRAGHQRIFEKQWFQALKNLPDPHTGEAIALDSIQTPGRKGYQNPPGEEHRTLISLTPGGEPLSVLKGYSRIVRQMVTPSGLQDFALGKAAISLNAKMKHGVLLILDSFHLGRLMAYSAASMGKEAGYNGGYSALEFRPQDLQRAVSKGLVDKESADWARGVVNVRQGGTVTPMTRMELGHELQKKGLNVGRVHDALYMHFADKIPLAGSFNKWLFDRFTRGLMLQTAVQDFTRLNAKHPNYDAERLMRMVVKDTNAYYGSLGRQGIIKSATGRDIANLLLLAPQWVEGLIRKELTLYGRLIKAPYNLAKGQPVMGTIGRAMGRGLVSMLAITQMLNLITRRQPTWQNEEEGHKLDAWIPSFSGKKEGFWLSPLSLFAEVTHDLVRLAETKPRVWDAIRQVGENKLGFAGRFGLVMATGQGPTGEYPTTTGGVLKTAASQVIPYPIAFSKLMQAGAHAAAPGTFPAVPAGATERQVYASTGIKIEPGRSATQRISDKARDFVKEEHLQPEMTHLEATDEASYSKLRAAIRNKDRSGAVEVLQDLRETRTDAQILKAMKTWAKRAFTGSQQHERLFLSTLNDHDLDLYSRATQERMDDLQEFYDFFLGQPEKD